MSDIKWLAAPATHDYAAAESYLNLNFSPQDAARIVRRMRAHHNLTTYKAKDILRASGLALLDTSNVHVQKDTAKIQAGTALSPILLVRGLPLIVADGYHRVCAVYHHSEDEDIPVVLAGRPGDTRS